MSETVKTLPAHGEKTAIYKLRRKASEETNLATTLISDFQYSECESMIFQCQGCFENGCLLQFPSVSVAHYPLIGDVIGIEGTRACNWMLSGVSSLFCKGNALGES